MLKRSLLQITSRRTEERRLPILNKRAVFERMVSPHLDAAYNLARWLTRDDHNAQDVLQESCLRAYQYLDGFRGENAKSWLLTIVRNTCYSWLEKNRPDISMTAFDEQLHSLGRHVARGVDGRFAEDGPETQLLLKQERDHVQRCLEDLPVEFREVVVLRELEGLSYKEIGAIASIPIGTVMSRLSRGRDLLQKMLGNAIDEVN